MKEVWAFLNNLIDRLDLKKLIMCVFFVLAMMVVPKVNFLKFLMPLDNAEKWIKFIFAFVTTYIVLSSLNSLWDKLNKRAKYRPKKVFGMMGKYGEYINLYYSNDINEFSIKSIDLYRYGISPDIVNKLYENNIIEMTTNSYYGNVEYKLTRRARIKLTRIKKFVLFIDSKIINRTKMKDDNNE